MSSKKNTLRSMSVDNKYILAKTDVNIFKRILNLKVVISNTGVIKKKS